MHRKIQKRQGADYHAEVSMKHRVEQEEYQILLEGRADGEPKVQPPLFWMLMAGRDICTLALRCRRLMALMSL